jgi:hypothetical protein
LPLPSNAGMPDTNTDLPTLTALDTGMPRTGLPMYSKGSAFSGLARSNRAAKSNRALVAPVMEFDPFDLQCLAEFIAGFKGRTAVTESEQTSRRCTVSCRKIGMW